MTLAARLRQIADTGNVTPFPLLARDLRSAADRLVELEAALDAHRDEVKRLHYWLRCVDADTVSIRDDVATALKPQFIELPS